MSPKELPSSPRPLATSTAERLAVIVEAAEKAAASVIDDAEEQARRYLDEARAEADRIVAERLRAVADELDPPASAPRSAPHLKPVESPPSMEEAGSAAALRSRNGSAGARLLATQMAVSGSSREEIEARLRSGFEIEDASGILDAILGPEE
jgi:cell division septum initiation protein DivIVA